MDTETLLKSLKSEWKLKASNSGGVFGLIKRIPLHIFQPATASEGDGAQLEIIMSTASAQTCTNAVNKLKETGPLKTNRLTDSKVLTTKGTTIQLKLTEEQLADLDEDALNKIITETAMLISKVPQAVPWPAPGAKLVLLDGVVPTHLVLDEAGNVQSNQTGMFPLGKQSANVVLAGVYGLAAMLIGHLVWAYIYSYVYTSGLFQDNAAFVLYVLAALWFGALIGWLTIKGAGAISPVVSILITLLSSIGIFCGQILGYALMFKHQTGVFDFKKSTDDYMAHIMTFDMGSLAGLIFPVVTALFGAFMAASLTGSSKQKSKIEFAESGVHRQVLPAESRTASA